MTSCPTDPARDLPDTAAGFQHQSSLLGPEAEDQPPPGLRYLEDFIADHRPLFDRVRDQAPWNRRYRSRWTVTYGVSWQSGACRITRIMPGALRAICDRIESTFGYRPNNCVANFYPAGDNHINFHSDQDMEMIAGTGVTIISLGSVRTMVLRPVDRPRVRHAIALAPGSAFHLPDRVQSAWQHGIPAEAGAGPRISLSFRKLQQAANPS